MAAGIARQAADSGGETSATESLETGLAAADWSRAAAQIDAYLGAMGITAPPDVESLREQVRQQTAARAAAAPLEDPVEAVIEETDALFDRWLAAELDDALDPKTLCAARAALLTGTVPGWSARWAGITGDSLATAIRAALITPVPERVPLVMEPNRIDRCCHRWWRGLTAALDRLLRRSAEPADPAGGHP